MDRRFVTVLAVSLLFALAISGVFYQVVAGSNRGQRRPARIDKRNLVLASHALSVGGVLRAEDVKLTQVPVEEFPAGCFSRAEEVIGRPMASSILAEEPIREGRLAPRGSGLGLAPAIPPGMRAVAVKVNDVVGVAGFALPGMHVDVLATGRPPEGDASGSVTKTILQDILVLSAGQTIEPSSNGQAINAAVVTLLVTPQQAETLTLASEWRIQLVLRNGSDRTIENTPGRELWELSGIAHKRTAAAAAPPSPRPVVVVRTPTPPVPEEVVVFRGTKRTVEQVGERNP
jgi:pilus assembly protein CpaB